MFAADDGTLLSGVGDRQLWLRYRGAPTPVSVGPGAAGGWLRLDAHAQPFVGTVVRGPVMSPAIGPPWPTSLGHDGYAANIIVAGGPYWGASGDAPSIGAVPPGYADWKWHAISPDGIRVLVRNGTFLAWFPGALDPIDVTAPAVFVGRGCVILADAAGTLTQVLAGNLRVVPAQRPGQKYSVTSVTAADGASWLLYSSAELGRFISHRGDDASQGYDLDALTIHGPVGPTGITCADHVTVLGWCAGPEQQAADMRWVELTLGVGMVPFVTTPTPEPPDPNPEPEPEPEPMPPTDPLKPGKTKTAYLNLIAHAVHTRTGMPETGDGGAWQGVNEAWDQVHVIANDWVSAQALARGAFCRNGSDAIKIPQTSLDALSHDCRAIDQEYLQPR